MSPCDSLGSLVGWDSEPAERCRSRVELGMGRYFLHCAIIPTEMPRWLRLFRPQDFVWLLLFAGLLVSLRFLPPPVDPNDPGQGDPQEIIPLVALGIAQILEPRFPSRATTRSRVVWIVLKIVLGFIFIGFTGSINRPYSMVLLL